MRSVQSDELRKTLRTVLDAVKHEGESYEVLRYQTREAVLVPTEWYERAAAALGEGGDQVGQG